jgi:diguanylate cyclase (GGDEF)-like protein
MPRMDGHEVCRQLKANSATRSIPIVFLTSAASTNQKVSGLEMGAIDYVTKPFDPLELRARAGAALRLRRDMDSLASRAMTDDLTGLYSRKGFDRHLHAELARARRSGLPLACTFMELDSFQAMNRELNRRAIDEIIIQVACDLEKMCRREDVVCRYSEDRFAVLGLSRDAGCAIEAAERLRLRLKAWPIAHAMGATRITASFGIALSHFPFDASIVAEAEEALDRAKQIGGNRVEMAGGSN